LKKGDIPSLNEGYYVKIEIRDEGKGIPKENLHNIFDPFFSTWKGRSGLGLTTTYSIIKKHNGLIAVESELGSGTTFSIYLPADPYITGQILERSEDIAVKGRGRILIMDDEELIRSAAGEMLKYIGYDVEFARDGAEAIDIYKQNSAKGSPLTAVIMDLTIPAGMGGKEAVKRLLEIAPDAAVIVSSGYSDDPIMSDFKDYGFKGVVTKPYKIDDLSAAIRKATSRMIG
ncbi:MAG: response regulator, partial [Nitrospirae bacterium]|nr:response regulator [Nitrospirota bacterium]